MTLDGFSVRLKVFEGEVGHNVAPDMRCSKETQVTTMTSSSQITMVKTEATVQ